MNKRMKFHGIFLGLICFVTGLVMGCSDDKGDTPGPDGGKVELSVDNKFLSFVDAEASSQTLKVSSNVYWRATSSKSWCKLSQEEGNGNAEIKVSVTANSAMTSRTAEILVSAGSNYKDTVQVVQFGEEVEYIVLVNEERMMDDTLLMDCIVKRVSLRVASNVDFSLTQVGAEDWAELIPQDPMSAYDKQHVFTLNVRDNIVEEPRYAKMTFQQKGGKFTEDIIFGQQGFRSELRFNQNYYMGSHFRVAELMVTSLGVDEWEHEFVDEAGNKVSPPGWLRNLRTIKCTEFENNAGQRYYLRADCDHNTSSMERTCRMNIFYYDKGNKISKIAKITQLPWNGQASDSLVLLNMVEKNAVPAYGIQLGWSLDIPVTDWEKTKWEEVDGMKRLTILTLGEVLLCYDLTAELGNLDQLEELRIVKNFLSGPIPEELSMCTKLKLFHCFDNYNDELTFTPSAERSGITVFPGAIFEKCTQLKDVDASVNRFREIPAELSKAANLEVLDFSSNDIAEVNATDWSQLKKLRYLGMAGLRKYKGPFFDFILQLPALEELSLFRTNFDGDVLPDDWQMLPRLSRVNMGSCNLTGPLPASFGKCPDLYELNLGAGDQFEKIHNAFSGTLPESYGNLSKLRVFSVDGNNITGTIPASYAQLLDIWYRTGEKFIMINVNGNRMSGEIPAAIKNHDTWTGKVANRMHKDGYKVDCSIGDLEPEIYICPQQKGYGFTNCD